jgi:hypothetical protein
MYIKAVLDVSSFHLGLVSQPTMKPLAKQDQYYEHASSDEKSPGRDDEWSSPTHTRACNGRLRQILFPALIAIVALSGLVALFCLLRGHMAIAEPGEIIETILLAKRSSESGSKKPSFTRNKRACAFSIVLSVFHMTI